MDTKHLRDFLTPSESAHCVLTLDLGAGAGGNHEHLVAPGRTVFALDIDKPSLYETSSWRSGILGDAHDLPFANNSFGEVVCAFLLEHLRNPESVLTEIHRVLANKGRLFLAVPCRKGLPRVFGEVYSRLVRLIAPAQHEHLEIEHNFSYEEILRGLEKAGFHVARISHDGFPITSLIAQKWAWAKPVHTTLSPAIEKLHLRFLTVNSYFTCVRAERLDPESATWP